MNRTISFQKKNLAALMLMTLLSSVSFGGFAAGASLKAEARPKSEIVTLDDLVDGASPELSQTALFRAPALGESGTIQTNRIQEALAKLGVKNLDTGGLTQVVVIRSARRINTGEIEQAIAAKLAEKHGIDPRGISIVFDGASPAIVTPLSITGAVKVEDLNYDPRGRRLSASLAIAAADGSQRRPFRVSAAVIETSEVVILTRGATRNETLSAHDVTVERRPRESVPSDAVTDITDIKGRIARRSLGAGTMVRSSDIARPEIITRGEMVTIIYEIPGMVLTARGKASEAGGVGDVIPVQNPQSKRTIQATIVSPGRVSVSAPTLNGRVASAAQ